MQYKFKDRLQSLLEVCGAKIVLVKNSVQMPKYAIHALVKICIFADKMGTLSLV